MLKLYWPLLPFKKYNIQIDHGSGGKRKVEKKRIREMSGEKVRLSISWGFACSGEEGMAGGREVGERSAAEESVYLSKDFKIHNKN